MKVAAHNSYSAAILYFDFCMLTDRVMSLEQ